MGEVKVNIVYGEADFKDLFQTIIDGKINTIIYNVKNGDNVRYNDEDYLPTKEIIAEVEIND